MELTLAEKMMELCESEESRDKWFKFCKENSPIVDEAMNAGRLSNLNETESLRVTVCLLVHEITKYIKKEWEQVEKDRIFRNFQKK